MYIFIKFDLLPKVLKKSDDAGYTYILIFFFKSGITPFLLK